MELFGRTQHALAFHSAQLTNLDHKGLAILAGRQLGTNQRARHPDAYAGIGRAADDIEQFWLADINCADAQAVCIGVLLCGLDLTDHYPAKWRGYRLELLHFQASHGEGLGQNGGRDRRIAEGAEPGFRELHVRLSNLF